MAENFLDASGAKPVSWWMFEEADVPLLDGNTTNNNDLTKVGAPTFQSTDHIEGSFSVITSEGTAYVYSSFVNLSSNFPFKGATANFTLGGWIKVPTGTPTITFNPFTDDATHGYRCQLVAGQLRFTVRLASPVTVSSNSSGFTTSQWVHYVARWQGSTDDELSLFINGVKQTSTGTVAAVGLNTGVDFFYLTSLAGFTFSFDEWFLFDVALTDAQIDDIYQHGLAGDRNVTADSILTPGTMIKGT